MSHGSAIQRFQTFILFLLSSFLAFSKAEKQCATYSQRTCLFGEIDTANALCSPIPCKFDTKQVNTPSMGTYYQVDSDPYHFQRQTVLILLLPPPTPPQPPPTIFLSFYFLYCAGIPMRVCRNRYIHLRT